VFGYSGTPLIKKLGIKDNSVLFISNAPKNYLSLLTPMPQRIKLVRRIAVDTDIVHIFETKKSRMVTHLNEASRKLRLDGVIWVSWPKKTSKVPSDIDENIIREMALSLDLVDVKVCAVDDTWSALKLVSRRKNRKMESRNKLGH
jgi:hypothetical protein